MLEKKTAKSAEAKSKGKAKAAPGVKKVTTPVIGSVALRPAAPKRRKDDLQERIRRRAYELWENEGRPQGREQAHWLQAEREVARARRQRVGASH
jgi:hypothetical protein